MAAPCLSKEALSLARMLHFACDVTQTYMVCKRVHLQFMLMLPQVRNQSLQEVAIA